MLAPWLYLARPTLVNSSDFQTQGTEGSRSGLVIALNTSTPLLLFSCMSGLMQEAARNKHPGVIRKTGLYAENLGAVLVEPTLTKRCSRAQCTETHRFSVTK